MIKAKRVKTPFGMRYRNIKTGRFLAKKEYVRRVKISQALKAKYYKVVVNAPFYRREGKRVIKKNFRATGVFRAKREQDKFDVLRKTYLVLEDYARGEGVYRKGRLKPREYMVLKIPKRDARRELKEAGLKQNEVAIEVYGEKDYGENPKIIW